MMPKKDKDFSSVHRLESEKGVISLAITALLFSLFLSAKTHCLPLFSSCVSRSLSVLLSLARLMTIFNRPSRAVIHNPNVSAPY